MVCSVSSPMHSSTGQNKRLSSLPGVALQNRLTALQCLITNALQHWSKQNAFLAAQTCSAKQADSRLVSLQIDLWVFAQHTCLQCLTTNALQHWSKQNAFLTTQTCFAKQADSRLVSLQIDLWVFANHTGVQ